jgi:hypothetical protein
MESNRTRRYKLRNKKKKRNKKKRTERYQKVPYSGILRETEREEDRETAGEDQ